MVITESSSFSQDGKPKESLSSKSNSDFIGKDIILLSCRHSEGIPKNNVESIYICYLLYEGHISQIHKESAPRISAKVKCENAPRKKVANDDFSAVKVSFPYYPL